MGCMLAAGILVLLIAQPQQEPAAIGGPAFYEAVVDRLFASPPRPGSDEVILRSIYDPVKPELQVRMFWPPPGAGVEIELWFLPPNALPIHRQLEELASASRALSVDKAVSSISVRRRSLTLSISDPLVVALRKVFSLVVPLSTDQILTLDAQVFELTLETVSKTIRLRAGGPDRLPPAVDPLYRWMEETDVVLRRFLASQ